MSLLGGSLTHSGPRSVELSRSGISSSLANAWMTFDTGSVPTTFLQGGEDIHPGMYSSRLKLAEVVVDSRTHHSAHRVKDSEIVS